jgi:quercetin dioxygenase-like cupin family protein
LTAPADDYRTPIRKESRMNTLTRRGLRLALVTVTLAGVFIAVNAIPGAATPPVGFTSQVLGRGTYQSHESLALPQGTDVVVSKITVAPRGSSGWHSHPGGAIVVVQQGEITIYASDGQGDGRHCVITRYTQGQSFVELPGRAVDAVNTGTIDFILFVTFPGVPVNGSSRTDQANPGVCPV